MTRRSISADEYRLAIDMLFNDHLYLARWTVIRCPAAAEKHAMVALTFNAECDWSWRKLASYALHELKAIEAERQLTPLERDIRRIAEQVYDAKVSAADRFGIDVFPEDTDRAAARRELDERFQRAHEELKPYFSKKEPTIQ